MLMFCQEFLKNKVKISHIKLLQQDLLSKINGEIRDRTLHHRAEALYNLNLTEMLA